MNNPEGTHTDISEKKSFSEFMTGKTLKRELAAILVMVWFAMLYRMFVFLPSDQVVIYMPLFTAASAPMWIFISGAFALDAMKKK